LGWKELRFKEGLFLEGLGEGSLPKGGYYLGPGFNSLPGERELRKELVG